MIPSNSLRPSRVLSAAAGVQQARLPFDLVPSLPKAPLCAPFPGSPQFRPEPAGGRSASDGSPFVYIRHPRARRYVLRVRADGVVCVTIPRGGSRREGKAFADTQHAWIERQRRRVHEQRMARVENLSDEEEGEYRVHAARVLPPRLLELAGRHGLKVRKVSIRNQRGRWGSCSPTGHICLNWRLARMPDWVCDYVLIHELMHLKRMDHSPEFWGLVAEACPRFLEARAYLKTLVRPV